MFFQAIEEPFLQTIQDTLGPKYRGHLGQIYEKLFKFILQVMIAGFRQQMADRTRQHMSMLEGAIADGMSSSLPIAISSFV